MYDIEIMLIMFMIVASEKVVPLPQGTQEVTIMTKKTVQEQHMIITDVAPTFSSPLPPETTVNECSTARLEAYIDAQPAPRITWHVNGRDIKPSIKYTISMEGKRSVLLIKNITQDDTGVYTCRAVSGLGEAVCSTTIYVIRKCHIKVRAIPSLSMIYINVIVLMYININ